MTALHVVFCLCLLVSPVANAQEGKLIVADSDSKDLKRTAYRMHIPVDRLKNAREALREATELAKKVRPVEASSFSALAHQWVMYNRAKAKSSIKELFSVLRSEAQDAREARAYMSATSAAGPLLRALAQVDYEEALQLVRRWPEAPESFGEAASRAKPNMERQFRMDAAASLSYRDPSAALTMWSEAGATATADFGTRAQMAETLAAVGRKEEAVKVLDQALSDLATAAPDSMDFGGSDGLLEALAKLAPDRFMEGFRTLTSLASKMPISGTPSVTIGGQQIPLENGEAMALQFFRQLNRPALVMESLEAMPELKSKLSQAGGIDSVLSGQAEISYAPHGEVQPMGGWAMGPPSPDPALFANARKDPQGVLDKILGQSPSAEQVDNLLALAARAAEDHPEVCSAAVEKASKLLSQVGRETQYRTMQMILMTSRQCDGEANPEIMKRGFLLVAELRENEKEKPQPSAGPYRGSSADMLERTLLSEMCIDNFEAAMKYVRGIPDDKVRLSTLVSLVQASARRW